MDALCLKAGIHGMTLPIAVAGNGVLEVRTTHSAQISATAATGRSLAAGKSLSPENPSVSSASERNSPWGFTFRKPLRSPGGKNWYEPAVAVDDAVWVDGIRRSKVSIFLFLLASFSEHKLHLKNYLH
ncbi:Lipase 3 domain-containing protein [Abeliophyllum distichum]|uniref:Lipase 3 domain-containing protein n=1 Tax=Abeliophyllum distichum TaxID=126358 RepID=A0ABD1UJI7_9LAMI